ncbi:ABC transporter permease [Aeromonas sobria]|uniref:Sugar ABC transporter permease n=1 Tax=Aeromonas sobria TaxID=646 RepID=A0A1S2CSZ6_AERSO|nr:ABC transporter permease [Aeromonas sobria]MBS4688949.1 ABC transporter permease [Aeromonas sobria]OHY91765.1 sugar ABC transporter permease [Aeromonas sobria]
MRQFLLANRAPLLTGLILLLLWGLFTSISPVTFFHGRIYTSLLSTIPLTILLALGMTLLIIAREIDMSFPAVIALGGFIFAWLFQHTGSPLLALLGAMAGGLLCGLLNALLIVQFQIPSIIATIGTQFFIGGLTTVLADGLALSLPEIRDTLLHTLLTGRVWEWLPAQALWSLLAALLLWLLLAHHALGDNINFIGDNPEAARLMGVPVNRMRLGLFMLMGLLAALVGVLISVEMSSWWPNQGQGYMLLVFASVFIGGTSVLGGRGTLLGSLFGACIIGMLEAGIISAGLDGFWTRLVYGVMILAALMIHGSMLQLQQGRWRSRFFK